MANDTIPDSERGSAACHGIEVGAFLGANRSQFDDK